MKTIDYENSKGTFEIKFLEDNEIVSGTINIDDNSMKLDAKLATLIVDYEIGDIVELNKNVSFKILKKDMDMHFIEINDYDYFTNFKNYNFYSNKEEEQYSNISLNGISNNESIINFQFYYKTSEQNIKDTPSFIIKSIIEKGPRISDSNSPKGYFKEFDTLCRTFKTMFMSRLSDNLEDYIYVNLSENNQYNIDGIKLIIEEITKRNVLCDGTNTNIDFKGKNVIIITGVSNSTSKLIELRNTLKDKGANKVLLYSFARSMKEN